MNNNEFTQKKYTTFYVVPKSDVPDDNLLLPTNTDAADGVNNYEDFRKVYMFGEKFSGLKSTGPPQDYLKLQQYHVKNKTLFIDENFSPKNIEMPKIKGEVVWQRPFEIVENPELFVDGADRFDVDQGLLGNCWFLAAVANLTSNKKLFSFVVPDDQSFKENYAGIFHFRFWQFGRWIDIVIDDRLPTVDNKLIFLKSSEQNEFWPALLEKAYAKFYGSYRNLEGGQITEALEDLSGGLSEYYIVKDPRIYDIMKMSLERKSFMGASIVSEEIEGKQEDGLVTSHAYSVTDVKTINVANSEIKLLRLRSPWGNNVEWNGKWSDSSEYWNSLPVALRNKLRTDKSDGEFWIELDDFQRCFTFVDICHLNPNSFLYKSGDRKKWTVIMFEDSWVPNVTAGGGLNYIETFCNNPQYHLTIKGNNSDSNYAMIIGLMQKDRRTVGESELLPLEINMFRVKSNVGTLLDQSFFDSNDPVLHEYGVGQRQLTVRVVLPVGRYCIIPSTSTPNQCGSYLLRVYSEVSANALENDVEVGYDPNAVLNQEDGVQNKELPLFKIVGLSKAEIGWGGVQKALNKMFGTKRLLCFMKPKISFRKETCKNIVALWDSNYSGKLDYNEFEKLLNDVAKLKEIFKKFDKDNSGKLDGFELKNLLSACGYNVDRQILKIIMLRYGTNDSISFENFVVCAFKLKTMIDQFKQRKTADDSSEQINVSRRDWLQTTLYS